MMFVSYLLRLYKLDRLMGHATHITAINVLFTKIEMTPGLRLICSKNTTSTINRAFNVVARWIEL